MKIAIGICNPRRASGVLTYINNIIHNSRHDFDRIRIPYMSMRRYITARRIAQFPVLEKMVDPYGAFAAKYIFPKYDVIHLQGDLYWPELYKYRRYDYPKYIHTAHNYNFEEDTYDSLQWKHFEILNNNMIESFKRADMIISVSKWLREFLKQEYGIYSTYVPNGVNTDECKDARPDEFKIRYKLDGEFVLFIGNLKKVKRPRLFIELASSMPDKKFVMAGPCVFPDAVEETTNVKIPPNLFCIGPLDRRGVVDAMAACKVFVLTSTNETFGMVLLEAMASKKPVVGSSTRGPMEIIENGIDGACFEPDNLDSLIKATEFCWDHPELGKKGYEKVVSKYNWKNIVLTIDLLYEETASRK
jgi:glycosyltransferase involved in cell wall biosynthesis